jgi:hypothetical protein
MKHLYLSHNSTRQESGKERKGEEEKLGVEEIEIATSEEIEIANQVS